MSVYKEGYYIVEQYNKKCTQIWNDSADEGIFVKKGEGDFNNMMQLVEWYGDKNTRKVIGTGNQVSIEVTLIDEWAVSDERKTIKEATDKFQVLYYKFRKEDLGSCIRKGFDGFFSISKIK